MFKRASLVGGAVPIPSPLATQQAKTANSSTAKLTPPIIHGELNFNVAIVIIILSSAPPPTAQLTNDKENKPHPPLLDPKYLSSDPQIKWQANVTPNVTTTLKYSPVTLAGGGGIKGTPVTKSSSYFPNSTQ